MKKFYRDILMARISFQKYPYPESYGYSVIMITSLITIGVTSAALIVAIAKSQGILFPKIYGYIWCALAVIFSQLYSNHLKREDFFNKLKEECQHFNDDEIRHVRIVGCCKFAIAMILPVIGMLIVNLVPLGKNYW
jgi:hypothetical protein